MIKVDDVNRLNDIVAGVSELPIENQEYVLAVIRGMLFTQQKKTFTQQKGVTTYEL